MHKTLAPLVVAASLFSGLNATAQAAASDAQSAVTETAATPQELNFNFFRNPSVGLEYRWGKLAVHGGVYPTVISKDANAVNETSWFVRAGVTSFFWGHAFNGQRPSEFYASASYLRGLNLGHGNALLSEAGYRWMVWQGINLRLGVAVMLERDHDVKVNPTPGLGWSQAF